MLFFGAVLGFLAGVGFASVVSGTSYTESIAFGMLGVALAACTLFIKQKRIAVTLSVLCIAAAFGILRFEMAEAPPSSALESHKGGEVSITGIVSKEPDARINTTHVTVSVEQVAGNDARGTVLAFVEPATDVSYGDRVYVRGVLETPAAFETDTGTTFDYPQFLAKDGIYHVLYYPELEQKSSGHGNPAKAVLFSAKQTFIKKVNSLIPAPESSLLSGLLLGTKHALGDTLSEQFRDTGVIHVVVLSGYNVTLVADGIMRAAANLPQAARVGGGALSIIAFAIMTGASATVVRASLMALLVLAARVTGRTYAITRALIFAALVMVIHDPHLLVFDPGFQLSFVATVGLIHLAPRLSEYAPFIPERFQLREIATATVSTQLFVLPLLLAMTGEISLIAPLANMLVLIAVPAAMLTGFIAGVVGFISTLLALPIAFIAQAILSYQLGVVAFLADVPLATLSIPALPMWAAVVLYGIIGVCMWFRRAP